MHSHDNLYLGKLRGCWIGKNLGGAIGMPFEGCPGPRLEVGEPAVPAVTPNDDLEMQMLALAEMERTGNWPEPRGISRMWLRHVGFAPDEYGVALRNLEAGIPPPASGAYDNWFRHGMGAVIRTEIWACLAPGDPSKAATLASNDASIDHTGEGVWATAFLAAVQSDAFAGNSLEDCIRAGAALVPPQSMVPAIIAETRDIADSSADDATAVKRVHGRFHNGNFADCLMNLAFIVLALLRGGGDFRRTMRIALMCGEDSDCTCASAAATLGIANGEDCFGGWEDFPEEIAYGPGIDRLAPPPTVSLLVERLALLQRRLENQPAALWTPAADHPRIRHTWFVHAADGVEDAPEAVVKAFDGDLANGKREVWDGVFHVLAGLCSPPPAALHLAARIEVARDFEGWMMIAADAGITARLDGRIVANHHSRRPMLPAFHRTEGGCCFRVRLAAGKPARLHVRLIHPNPPFGFCVNLADDSLRPNADFRLSI